MNASHVGYGGYVKRLLSTVLVMPLVTGCTDLSESPTSVITPDNFNRTEQEVMGSLAAVYHELNADGAEWAYYNLSQISSDEMIVPTRGSDWFDNGRWLEIQRHNWSANSPAGLDDINRVWIDSYRGITRANVLIAALEELAFPEKAVITAELRTLRAFYYYMLLDMFGGVPIATEVEIAERPRSTRAELFQFIADELQSARGDLPAEWPAADHGRMTQGAADAILASMYLNAGVFTNDAPNATAYNSCTAVQVDGQDACEAAIQVVDRILDSGVYGLATDWRSNFTADNASSPENILVTKHSNETGLGLNFVMRALHYNQFNPSPWNGFAALADAYNSFDADDARREIFLVGPQVHVETGQPVDDRAGNPLVFTVDIDDATQAGEGEGPRIIKWPPDPDHSAEHNGNDFTWFRLSEMHLIKAEALLETGNAAEALSIVNMLRERAFEPDEPLGAIDRETILEERLFELTAEAKRRQDLIRHGQYTQPWEFKEAGGAHLVLMPIPQTQLDANPMLTQNPGY